MGIAVGADGALYIADSGRHLIRRVSPGGTISTLAGALTYAGDGATADVAQLNRPRAIAIAPDGVLYVADTDNARVRKVNLDGTITLVAGGGTPGSETVDRLRLPSSDRYAVLPSGQTAASTWRTCPTTGSAR